MGNFAGVAGIPFKICGGGNQMSGEFKGQGFPPFKGGEKREGEFGPQRGNRGTPFLEKTGCLLKGLGVSYKGTRGFL